jgi:GST-like protein
MFESGAILLYLGEKTGRFMPAGTAARYRTVQWLMFQMGHVGPMLGQAHHFREYAVEKLRYAIERYTKESARLIGVIDRRLGETAYLAGDDYTVADMAVFPWLRNPEREGWNPADYPNMSRWFTAISQRPAVQRALEVQKEHQRRGPIDDTWRHHMFGDNQHVRR